MVQSKRWEGVLLSRMKQEGWAPLRHWGRMASHCCGSLPVGRGFLLLAESPPSSLIRTWLILDQELTLSVLLPAWWSLDVGTISK